MVTATSRTVAQTNPDLPVLEGEILYPRLGDTEDFINVMYYGEPGTGKTTHLASLAHLGLLIVVDAEGGLKRRALRDRGIPVENIEPRRIRNYNDLDQLYWEVRSRIEANDDNRPIGVAFDSMTELQKVLTEEQVTGRVSKAVDKASRLGIVPKDSEVDPWKTQLDDYGIMTEQLRRTMRKFRDLDCHVGISALSKRDQDDDGEVTYRPALTPAIGSDLRGFVDIVVATQRARHPDPNGTKPLIGVTQTILKQQGKDRFGVLPAVMRDPTWATLVRAVNDNLDISELEY